MKKTAKNILVCLLIWAIFINSFSVVYAGEETNMPSGSDTSMEIEAEGTDSVGDFLVSEIQTQKEEQEQNNGNCIISLEFDDEEEDEDGDSSDRNTAYVSFSARTEAELIVGVYDEKHIQMLAYGKTEVNEEDTYAEITVDINEMPTYFTATAYLLDKEDHRPLCQEYTTEMYTKEMQELKKSTVDDYNLEDVLQLDGDNTETNFAVYNDETVVIEESEGTNDLKDKGNGVIEICNADNRITGLKKGDTLSYKYRDGSVLLIKIVTIKVDGTKVILTQSDNSDLTDYFDYVKIEADSGNGRTEIDNDNLDSGVTYEGEEQERNRLSRAFDFDEGLATSVKYKISKKVGKGNVDASLKLQLNFHVQFYSSINYKHFFAGVEYSNSVSLGVSGKSDLQKIKLSGITQYPIPCIKIKCKVYFVIKISGEFKWEGEWKGSIGFDYDSNHGIGREAPFQKPTFKSELKLEGKVFVGLSIEPNLSIIDENICETEMDVMAGAEIEAKRLLKTNSDESIHECSNCIDGKVNLKIEAEAKLNILKNVVNVECKIASFKEKVMDFYWSRDKNRFGLSKCPYTRYKVDIIAVDNKGNAVPNGEVTVYDRKTGTAVNIMTKDSISYFSVKLNDKGKNSIYLPNGSYTVKVKRGADTGEGKLGIENRKTSKRIKVRGQVDWTLKDGTLQISAQGEMPDYGSGEAAAPWMTRKNEIRKIIINKGTTYIGTKAFYNCENLAEVQIAQGVKSIGDSAFEACSKLETVTIPDSVKKIGNSAFCNCYKLINFQLPSRIREIGENAFGKCSSIHDVIFPETLEKIGSMAFLRCDSLKSVKMPSGVKEIGYSVFWECKGLEEAEIPATGIVAELMFYNCERLKKVILHEGILEIQRAAFYKCSALETIEIPESVEGDACSWFYDCTALKRVILKCKITSIDYTFINCTSLTEIEIPKSVEYISGDAFDNCIKLSKMYFKGERPCMDEKLVFRKCNFTAYYPEGDETWDGIEDVEFENATIKWVPYKSEGKKDTEILADTEELNLELDASDIQEETSDEIVIEDSETVTDEEEAPDDETVTDEEEIEFIDELEMSDESEEIFNNDEVSNEIEVYTTDKPEEIEESEEVGAEFDNSEATTDFEEFADESGVQVADVVEGSEEAEKIFTDEERINSIEFSDADLPEESGVADIEFDSSEVTLDTEGIIGSNTVKATDDSEMPEKNGEKAAAKTGTSDINVQSDTEEETLIYTKTDLKPNGLYLFVVVKDDMEKDLLNESNVLYISQKTADETGAVSFEYKMIMNYPDPVLLIMGTPVEDIENAQIEINSLTANEKVQFPEVTVTYKGEILVENSDYEVSGDTWVVDPGTYSLIISGINEYGGSLTKEYTVNQSQSTIPVTHEHVYGKWNTIRKSTIFTQGIQERKCQKCGAVQKRNLEKLVPTGSLNMTSIPLKIKQKTNVFKVKGLANGDSVKSYSSSNKKIFTVSSNGKITAKKKGTATLTVTLASGKQLKAKVKVQKGTVRTSKISVKERSISLKKGKKYQIKASVSPLTSQERVTYSTSNKKIATVDKKGKVVAKKKGKAVITVKSGKKKTTVKITVK